MGVQVVWFNQVLRVSDHAALSAAAAQGPVLPVFILDPDVPAGAQDAWAGGAKRWWLHGSLERLGAELKALGSPLILRRGDPAQVLADLARDVGASVIHATRPLDPLGKSRMSAVQERSGNVRLMLHPGVTLFAPEELLNLAGYPYQVFTPFWKALLAKGDPPLPLPCPARLAAPPLPVRSDALADFELLPSGPDWAGGLRRAWIPGTVHARERLATFLDSGIERYDVERDIPAHAGTSRLSPYLASGEISPREVWHAVRRAQLDGRVPAKGADSWLRQLAWREFAWHLLAAYPEMLVRPLRAKYEAFPWREDPTGFRAWTRGETGYPIVDAGMRQLWETGWMHNRVRMIVASFLVKDLLIPWQAGARWFEDTLVDADLACNAFGWQWVAGSGADSAPFFRIFNPVTQAQKFDPAGEYIQRWLPELRGLTPNVLHEPWGAGKAPTVGQGCERYPRPMVSHAFARERALQALAFMKDSYRP